MKSTGRCRRVSIFCLLWKAFLVCLFSCACGYASNAIQIENSNPGTADWQLSKPATNREIEGYASLTSVNLGNRISFFVSTSDPTFNIQIYRTGWYGGLGARLMTSISGLTGSLQPTPDPDPVTGLIDCGWTSSYTLSVPATWTSGVYLARLTGTVSGKQSYIIFVVRDDSRTSDLVFESSVTTFEAYNFWPGGDTGKSLYDWAPGKRAWKVSFNRPYVLGYSYSESSPGAASGVGAGEYVANLQPGPNHGYPIPAAGFEYNMVRWLEANGYDVTYVTDVDMHENPALLQNHKAFLSVGHNEYWSMPMVQNLQNAMSTGVNAGFFSANTMYWQIRFEPDTLGNSDRIMVCYKGDAASNDPLYYTNPQFATTEFRNDPVNMPEAGIVGVEYIGDPVTSDIVISNASHWLMNGTGLHNGDHLTGLLGYEVDAYVPGVSPTNTVVLASSPIGFPDDVDNPPGFACQSVACNANMTWYSNGRSSVFATGSMFWSWGLDDFNAPALRSSYLSPAAQQLTKNVLAALINPLVVTTSSLPNGVAGSAYTSYQLTSIGGSAPYNWSVSNLPPGMVLSASGVLSGTPTSAETSSIAITVTDSTGNSASTPLAFIVQAVTSGNGGSGALSITTTALPSGVSGTPFTQTLVASGGAPPYQWSVVNGALPSGLTLSAGGQLAGTPQNAGTFHLTIQVTDSSLQSATRTLQLVFIGTVDPFLTSSMDTTHWCQCVLDQASGSQNLQTIVQQGNGQFTITPHSGLAGMNYNGYGASTPLDMTDAALSVQVSQATTGSGYTDTSFALAADTQNWYRFTVEGGTLYLQKMMAGVKSGAAVPYNSALNVYWRFRHSSATSQIFLETSANGASWTVQWQTSATIPVTSLLIGLDAGTWGSDQNTGQAVFANLRWEPNSSPPLPYISAASLSSGTAGVSYTAALAAMNGASPYQWSLASGSLPPGLGLSSTGSLSGVPTTAGTFSFTAETKDANLLTATQVFQITITPSAPLGISTASLPNGAVNSPYSQTLTAAGGTSPYQWSLLSGSLPAGLTLNASGQMAGTPTAAGAFSFTVQAKDSLSATASQSLHLTIATQTYAITGFVTLSGSGLAGVTISVNGTNAATTSSTGAFSISGLTSGTYTVSAGLSGYVFSPPNQTFSNITANQTANFSASGAAATSHAISIDFVGNGTPMGSAETAGVISKPHWNNAVGNRSTTALNLVDETSAPTTATLTWAADNTWSTPIADALGNIRMMKGYLDAALGNPITVTITGLSPSSTGYDVYVYFDADNGSATKTITYALSGAGITKMSVVGQDAANKNFNGVFTRAQGQAGNYVLFTVQTTTFTLTATPTKASDSILRAAVNGIQIIPH